MIPSDPVGEFLKRRGCADDIVREGFAGLLARWERIAREVAAGYDLPMEDYLNDLDARQILAEAGVFLSPGASHRFQPRLAAADREFRAHTRPVDECLWGAENEEEMGLDAVANWWYYRLPDHPGPGFPG